MEQGLLHEGGLDDSEIHSEKPIRPRRRMSGPFHSKTTEKSNCPKACPGQELQMIRGGLCHLMSPWVLHDLRAFDQPGISRPAGARGRYGREGIPIGGACEKGITHERKRARRE